MRILALFDDGNGSVKKALPDHEVVSVGIGNADIVMDLSDMKNIKKLVDMHKENPFDLLMGISILATRLNTFGDLSIRTAKRIWKRLYGICETKSGTGQ